MSSDKFWSEVAGIAFGIAVLSFAWGGPIAWVSDAPLKSVVGPAAVMLLPTSAAIEVHHRWNGLLSGLVMWVGLAVAVVAPPVIGIMHAWGDS